MKQHAPFKSPILGNCVKNLLVAKEAVRTQETFNLCTGFMWICSLFVLFYLIHIWNVVLHLCDQIYNLKPNIKSGNSFHSIVWYVLWDQDMDLLELESKMAVGLGHL